MFEYGKEPFQTEEALLHGIRLDVPLYQTLFEFCKYYNFPVSLVQSYVFLDRPYPVSVRS